ncbi:PilX N-terminal domain-containing pilus assembly protein [Thermodesulfobacteriota bacterium]
MNHQINIRNDEHGSAMVIALIILVLLTLMGISATTTSEIEIRVARNEKQYINEFIVSDSAWREGVEWLNTLASAPNLINPVTFSSAVTPTEEPGALNVKNFGDSGIDLLIGTPDGTLNNPPFDVNYWYEIGYLDEEMSMSGATVPGSGPNYRKFNFKAVSVGGEDTLRTVEVIASKVFMID